MEVLGFFVWFCVLQKSWDKKGVICLKKGLDLGDLGDLVTALAMLRHQEFALLL